MAIQYDVLVVGELNIDLILNKIDKFPIIGKEVLADQMTLTLGSSSAIFASNLRTLGTTVTYIGKLGKDDFGDHIIKALATKKVDTSNIIFSTKFNTGVTVVLNFLEERANVTYPGAMNALTIDDISDKVLQSAKHLHVSSIFLQPGLKPDIINLFKRAKEFGLTTSLDPQWDPAEKWDINLNELLQYVDLFFPNIDELKALLKFSDFDDCIKEIQRFKNIIIIKDSNKGAYLWNGNELIHQPAFLNNNVVDSIGAGDSFDAGFINKYIQNGSEEECLEFAALVGAINTTRSGGTGAFENAELFKKIAQSNFNYFI
jgi:sugar/nucleoside kinase (ribokinase family)